MAKKNDGNSLDQKQKKELERTLKQLGLDGRYLDLIHDAIINDWSPNRFVARLVRDDRFKRQFPGLVQGGEINDFLAGAENTGINADTLRQAIRGYNTLWQSYETIGKRYGYGKLTKQQLGLLIQKEISPDEFGRRAFAVDTVKKNPALFDYVAQMAKQAGVKLGPKDLFRFTAGVGDRKFYDIYEAARFQQAAGSSLGLNTQQALEVAKSLPNNDAQGAFTGFGNIDQLVSELKATYNDIGPDLAAQGISMLEVSKFIASGGTSNPDLAQKLANITSAKRGRGAYVAGTQARGGPAGAAQYEDQGAASYG